VRDSATAVQARGKQSRRLENYEAFYTRTTGIWQTVWLEPVAHVHLLRPRITPLVASGEFRFDLPLSVSGRAAVEVEVSDETGVVARATAANALDLTPSVTLCISAERLRLWSPTDPFLYDVRIKLTVDGELVDEVTSYAGMRSIAIDGKRVLLNGVPIFQRLVLDQGYYPDGLMTAPSDAALINDIRLAQQAGFNGARLHQKVFEERYLYHADRLGYLVWGEFGDWGANQDVAVGRQEPTASFVAEWVESVTRDYSHPSIIGWCPLNETYEPLSAAPTVLDDVTRAMYLATKAIDSTRPVIDASGYAHRVANADIYDSHLYEQDPAEFARLMAGLADHRPYVNTATDGTTWSVPYAGQPYFCSEFGGIWWSDTEREGAQSWGYGDAPGSRDKWWQRFEGLISALLDDPNMFGYCYTQLTDVFQEKNGLLTFDRKPKFDLGRIRDIQSRQAAIEVPKIHAVENTRGE
jgi:Beta-galactosidase/beta-glucuronidase